MLSSVKRRRWGGRTVITGVRWAESVRRKNSRNIVEYDSYGSNSKKNVKDREQFYKMNDNGQQKWFEHCPTGKGKHIVNPIVDWSDDNVWQFIKRYKLPYCELYDQGYKRLGCLACPLAGGKGMAKDFIRYPYIFKKYIKTFEKLIEERNKLKLETKWVTGHEVMQWWIDFTDNEYETLILAINKREKENTNDKNNKK